MTKRFDIHFTVFLIHERLKIRLCLKMVLAPLTSQMAYCTVKRWGGERTEKFISIVRPSSQVPHSDDWVFFGTFSCETTYRTSEKSKFSPTSMIKQTLQMKRLVCWSVKGTNSEMTDPSCLK